MFRTVIDQRLWRMRFRVSTCLPYDGFFERLTCADESHCYGVTKTVVARHELYASRCHHYAFRYPTPVCPTITLPRRTCTMTAFSIIRVTYDGAVDDAPATIVRSLRPRRVYVQCIRDAVSRRTAHVDRGSNRSRVEDAAGQEGFIFCSKVLFFLCLIIGSDLVFIKTHYTRVNNNKDRALKRARHQGRTSIGDRMTYTDDWYCDDIAVLMLLNLKPTCPCCRQKLFLSERGRTDTYIFVMTVDVDVGSNISLYGELNCTNFCNKNLGR